MPAQTATELRGLLDDELVTKLREAKEELFNLRFQSATGSVATASVVTAVSTGAVATGASTAGAGLPPSRTGLRGVLERGRRARWSRARSAAWAACSSRVMTSSPL